MIREDIPRLVMTSVTVVLSIIVCLLLVDFYYLVVRVRTGFDTMFAILAIMPTIAGEVAFALAMPKHFLSVYRAGRLYSLFPAVTAIQLAILGLIRVARVLVVRGASTSRPLSGEQLAALFGQGYTAGTIALFVAAGLLVAVAVYFHLRGRKNPYARSESDFHFSQRGS